MARGKSISSKLQIVQIMLIFVVPLLAFLLVYNFYTMSILNEKIAQTGQETISVYQQLMDENLRQNEMLIADIVSNDVNFAQFVSAKSDLQRYMYAYQLNDKMKTILRTNATISNFFICDADNNIYIELYNYSYHYLFKEELKAAIKAMLAEGTGWAKSRWFHKTVGDHHMLIRVLGRNESYAVCVFDFDNMGIPVPDISESGALLFYADESGCILTQADVFDEMGIDFAASNNQTYDIMGTGRKYVVVQSLLEYCSVNFIYAMPYGGIMTLFDRQQLFFLIFSILLIPLMVISYRLLNSRYFKPLESLIGIMEAIKGGQIDTQMTANHRIGEFNRVSDTFNEMMSQIKTLKMAEYEHQLESQQARLQYLQIQIRPHFFLNCLKNIYGLAQSRNYTQIQDMTLALSGYLRYILKNNTVLVSVATEVECVRNYILLQQICAAYQISCTFDIDQRLEKILIPPLSIQTFVENSIRHIDSANKHLMLHIKVSALEEDGQELLNVKILDNGTGFSQEQLTYLNTETAFTYQDEHIGIANVKHRFALIYKGKATFLFSNATRGACIEFFVPMNGDAETKSPGGEMQ